MSFRSHVFKFALYYPVALTSCRPVPLCLHALRKSQFSAREGREAQQLRRLQRIVASAVTNVPYYETTLRGLHSKDFRNLSDLARLPTLSKATLKARWDDLHVRGLRHFVSTAKTTGGSTGQPVTILKSQLAMAWELAAAWRGYSWAGVGIGDAQARFWGIPAGSRDRLKARLIDLVCHRHRCSAFAFTKEDLARYERRLARFRPVYFYGYASMLEEFARHFLEAGRTPTFELVAIISTAEVLGEPRRRLLERVFNTKVFDEYGCGEVGTIAHECEHGRMHLNSENLVVEVLDGDRLCNPGEPGEIVVTELHNAVMPLIRYRTGDYGIIDETDCPCGRTLPTLNSVYGRAYDFLTTPAGQRFHAEAVMYIFEDAQRRGLGVGQFQVIQEELASLLIRVVPMPGYSDRTERFLIEGVRAQMGQAMKVRVEQTPKIERERSGKMRLIVGLPSVLTPGS